MHLHYVYILDIASISNQCKVASDIEASSQFGLCSSTLYSLVINDLVCCKVPPQGRLWQSVKQGAGLAFRNRSLRLTMHFI